MSPIEPSEEHLRVCEEAARAGAEVLQSWRGRFAVSSKGPRDLVTEADLASQTEIRRLVESAFPGYGFEGEETLPEASRIEEHHAVRWVVDPLDGTTNYVHGYPAYCVSVALAEGDRVLVGAIYDPVSNECFTARAGHGAWLNGNPIHATATEDPGEALAAISFPAQSTRESLAVRDFVAVLPHLRAVRRSGSSALNLAYLAAGRLDAFWARRIASWDVAAGLLLVQEAGGVTAPLIPPGQPGGEVGETVPLANPAFLAASTPKLLVTLRDVMTAG
ncbi:MAG: inositol monophosphatase family protein [Pirellulales bacterium]